LIDALNACNSNTNLVITHKYDYRTHNVMLHIHTKVGDYSYKWWYTDYKWSGGDVNCVFSNLNDFYTNVIDLVVICQPYTLDYML